ncbi:Hypothetical Protein FCC1311_048172 [Hondaea fermentalgiana]|uniref:PPM-type phosphatase domain-containing protein n=1 Tax=Hondaea fermentalgiana TaxID=2315210 RepID=A0A2R5GC71_9STRA|nr:Hypothetical Protein FCC1311_048172 [Hondaea fermentalgiana]|eukprot:GBG28596.1 Hypothetical Protein FCC1311_048172 [Hondaea fermentalgiana]
MRSMLRKSMGRRSGDRKTAQFKPAFEKLLICDNGKDNVPELFVDNEGQANEAVACISQSRSPGHKNVGQDAIGLARHDNWDIKVLCDGHDRDGHDVSRAVCKAMPRVVLRMLTERDDPDEPPSEELLVEAFREVSDEVCWTDEDVHPGMFVKCFAGKWEGRVGFLAEGRDSSTAVLVVVDEDGYHRPLVERKHLKRPKFTGGTTCVLTVMNTANGLCRIAQTGDSRAMIFNMNMFEDKFMQPVFGVVDFSSDAVPPMGICSPAHSVFNPAELLRLNTDYAGAFEIDGAFLVNPLTKFSIQPTRGIGDFDVYGTGYISVPEVTSVFKLKPGSILLMASDGVFDDHVIKTDELVTFFADNIEDDMPLTKIANMLYDETLQRSLAGGYVDDISLIVYRGHDVDSAGEVPVEDLDGDALDMDAAEEEEALELELDEATAEELSKTTNLRRSLLGGLMKKTRGAMMGSRRELISLDDERIATKPDIDEPNPEDRRKTIDRTERAAYSDFLQEALRQKEAEDADDAAEGDEDAETAEMASAILGRFAQRYGHTPEEVRSGINVSKDAANVGRRVSASMARQAMFDEDELLEEDEEEAASSSKKGKKKRSSRK